MPKSYLFQTDWFTSTEHEWSTNLHDLRGKPNLNFLEIGSFEGRSAIWLLENILTHAESHLTCVDTWEGSVEHKGTNLDLATIESNFDHNIQASGFSPKVTKMKAFSHAALRQLPFSSFDFIYIDGSHKASNVLEDVVLSWRLLKTGGIVIFDDYVWEPQYSELESPKIAVDSFLRCYADALSVVKIGSQVTIKKT